MSRNSAGAGDEVIAIARAMSVLDAFKGYETSVTLRELCRRTKLPKTTVLRIVRSLRTAQYLVQLPAGGWRLGKGAGSLGWRYLAGFDQTACIEPELRELAAATSETAIFSVREGDTRVCISRVLGPHPLRHHVRVGEIRPVNRGAPGRVLLAFSGEPGEPYEEIRRAGYYRTAGERDPLVASVAMPVFGLNRVLIGCVSVSGPVERVTTVTVPKHIRALRKSAGRLMFELSHTAALSAE